MTEKRFDLYNTAVSFFLLAAFTLCYFRIGLGGDESGEFHSEIVHALGISYIKDEKPILLKDGNYPLAVPSKDSWLYVDGKRYFPLFLVMVEENSQLNLYPLNVKNESFLPHIGNTLPLHILMEFKTTYGENLLVYDEKPAGMSARDSYARKVYYYLHVSNGFGRIERGYLPRRSIALQWYKKPNFYLEELAAIYFLTNEIEFDDEKVARSVSM